MSGAAFLRIKKLKGGGIITVAARHNRRVIQAELGATGSIDPTRSHLNVTLQGPSTAADVGQLAKDLMMAAGLTKLRKDAVMALEIVFSLPPGHAIDDRAYFTDCAEWVGRYLGGVTLSVDIHRDEAQSHCHVLLLPLIDGRMAGSDMLGGKQKLMAMQKQFHLDVAARYGLNKAPARLTTTAKLAGSKAVLQKLRETGDAALKSAAWPSIRDKIESDPAPFLLTLGIELHAPAKKQKTMAAIFTGKGKGKAKESNPIGFATPEKGQTLCSVGFTPKLPPPTPAKPAPAPKPTAPPQLSESLTRDRVLSDPKCNDDQYEDVETVRVRDSDQDPNLYDPETGEFYRLPNPVRLHRHAVDAALSGLKAMQVRQRISLSVETDNETYPIKGTGRKSR